ncbi:MAG TPA: hypothetical protein VH143_31895 [Kofleriaceae bacterium]|jgi:hypothetical protein|nr:hypothetical protein [Kofleriaceae bacterium]
MRFTIDANLDAEARWAGRALPARVAERISPFAALLGALSPPDADVEIWAPAAVDAARIHLPDVAVKMRTGTPKSADLMWAQPDAKPVNDRRFALALAQQLGCALPGTQVIRDVGELSIAGPWVAKAPWTTAGRDRCFGTGRELPAELAPLLAQHGELVVEPWVPRALDVALCADTEVGMLPPHRLLTSEHGTFRGIELGVELSRDHMRELVRVARAARDALVAAGYRGPYGVDAFVRADGGFHPLCEINARVTFGHVTHALGDRFGARTLGLGPHAPDGCHVLVDGAAWIS